MHPAVRRGVVGLVLAASAVAGATVLDGVREGQAQSTLGSSPSWGVAGEALPNPLSRAFREATARALPGVVHVQVEAVRKARVEIPDPFRGTPWEDLFRRGRPSDPAPRQGSGSGFVFRSDGYILTNNHVVEGAERVTVVTQDRREFDARIVGRDPNTDLAVLKVEATDLPVVELGDSDRIEVGDWVVALGYPLRLGATVTAGIVSAKGRQLGIIDRNDGASAPLEHFIQTDAAINPGNSGGPLVNLAGQVVGINTAIASPTGYYSGYGFAVPVNLARRVAEDLIEHGAVRRPKLGVAIGNVTPADAEVYRLERAAGAAVVRIEAGSPAEAAGMRLGDVIVGVEGQPVESTGELMEALARYEPGQRVTLDVVRYGQRLRVPVTLDVFEPAVRTVASESGRTERGVDRLGFTAAELTRELARRLRIEEGRGVAIVRVEERGPAARAGLAPGMVLEQLNGRSIEKLADLEAAADEVRPGQAVSLIVRLSDGTRTIMNYRLRE